MDNSQSNQPNVSGGVNLSTGLRLPFFRPGFESPSLTSASDMNLLVAVCNLLLNFQVRMNDANQDADGGYTPTAKFTVSNLNAILDLFLAPAGAGGGTANIIPMQVVSYNTANEYLVAKIGTFTAADTFTPTGSNINVALPWEIRPGSPGAICPPYVVNDIIFVISTAAGMNGVYVSGSELLYMDLGIGRNCNQDLFTLGTMSPNYFAGTSIASGDTINIAKSIETQNNISSETIDGVTWTYTYQTTGTYKYVTRKADATISGTAVTEYQVIVPRYLSGQKIKCKQVNTGLTDGSSNPILWMEDSPRAWAARSDQSGYES